MNVGTPVKQVAPATQTKTTVSAAQPAQPVKTVAQPNSNANVQSSDNLSASNAAAKAWIAHMNQAAITTLLTVNILVSTN